MKKIPALLLFFSICLSASASESRFTSFHRFGNPAVWSEKTDRFPVLERAQKIGSLFIAQTKPFESFHPYDFEDGRAVRRPIQIDDLVYESLMLRDPIAGSDRIFPLIAKALRTDENMTYVIFELDPRARFQDGSFVTATEVLYSVEQYKASSPSFRKDFESLVKSTSAQGNEVRFDLKTEGQASRNAIMRLASLKIIKENTTGATSVGGIRVAYTATGPYRLTQLGKNKLSLIVDPSYWGSHLSTRIGFFNFREVEINAYQDENLARASLAKGGSNYLNVSQAEDLNTQFGNIISENQKLRLVLEEDKRVGKPIPSIKFNTNLPVVADRKVRQALLLAYDFDTANSMYFNNELGRPSNLLDYSLNSPVGEPSEAVVKIMKICPNLPENLNASEHGHPLYINLADKRTRLLKAQQLLAEAGFKLENGQLKRQSETGSSPLQLRLLMQGKDLRTAYMFRESLQRLGISLVVQSAAGESFHQMKKSADLYLTTEGFLNDEAWPVADLLKLNDAPECMAKLKASMLTLDAKSPQFTDTADAIARLHEVLGLSIFTGARTKKSFILDERLGIPEHLDWEKAHLYGYWIEEAPNFHPPLFHEMRYNGCMDMSCLFGGLGGR